MALTPAHGSWLHRNRVWLALLVPLVALALAASSWRWVTIYRPAEQTAAHRAEAGTAHLRQTVLVKDSDEPLSIDITATEAVRMGVHQGRQAPPGTVLYLVSTLFAADPDQPLLRGCGATVRDQHDAVYRAGFGTIAHPGADEGDIATDCLPDDAPGPLYDPLGGGVEQPDEGGGRPASWVVNFLFVLPEGRTPAELRVVFDLPDYAVLPLEA